MLKQGLPSDHAHQSSVVVADGVDRKVVFDHLPLCLHQFLFRLEEERLAQHDLGQGGRGLGKGQLAKRHDAVQMAVSIGHEEINHHVLAQDFTQGSQRVSDRCGGGKHRHRALHQAPNRTFRIGVPDQPQRLLGTKRNGVGDALTAGRIELFEHLHGMADMNAGE